MPTPKPVSDHLTNSLSTFVKRALGGYAERNRLMLGLRRQRYLRQKVSPPQPYQSYMGFGGKVPISFRLVQTVVGAVAGEERPRFHTISPDPEVASRTDRWLKLVVQAQERYSQPALYWRYWEALAGDGMSCLKTVRTPWTHFPARGPDEPSNEYNDRVEKFFYAGPPIPFRTRVLDPMTFFPPQSEWGWDVGVEYSLRNPRLVYDCLGVMRDQSLGKLIPSMTEPVPKDMAGLVGQDGQSIPVAEIWTPESLIVLVNDSQAFEFPNELGRSPYLYTFASAAAFSDPMFQGLSVTFPLLYIEPWINAKMTELIAFSALKTNPTPYTVQEGPPGAPAQAPQIMDFQAGKMHHFGPGVKVGVWDFGEATDTVQLLQVMVQMAERFTISPVPSFAGTRTAGTVMAQVAERMMSILRPLVDQAQVTWSELAKFYIYLVKDVIKAPVYVSGLSFDEHPGRRGRGADSALTPRDCTKITDVVADISFQTTTDKIAWHSHNVMMAQAGLWSERHAMLESDVDDPEAEDRQKVIEGLMKSPVVQAYVLQNGLQGQPPLEILMQLFQGEGEIGGASPALATPAEEEAPGPGRPAGATTSMPRAPGGTRRNRAPKGRLRNG